MVALVLSSARKETDTVCSSVFSQISVVSLCKRIISFSPPFFSFKLSLFTINKKLGETKGKKKTSIFSQQKKTLFGSRVLAHNNTSGFSVSLSLLYRVSLLSQAQNNYRRSKIHARAKEPKKELQGEREKPRGLDNYSPRRL